MVKVKAVSQVMPISQGLDFVMIIMESFMTTPRKREFFLQSSLELAVLKPDILMLDNIPAEEMKRIAEALKGKVILEATGGVTLDNLSEIAECGVQRVSIGAITHSAPAVDLGLDA